jgi:hypothetical protein
MYDIIKHANNIVNGQRIKALIICKLHGHDMHQAEIIKANAVYKMRCARCGKEYIFYQQLNHMAELPERSN